MLFYGSVAEGLAFLEADDEAWAEYIAGRYAEALERGDETDGDIP